MFKWLQMIWVTSILVFADHGFAKKISFSFDDAPRKSSFFTGEERSIKLLESLRNSGVGRAVFYINTSKVTDEGKQRISRYAKAGHLIGNHTHSHLSGDRVSTDVFLADFDTADRLLRQWGFQPTYFRYPYLHRGRNLASIHKIRNHILNKGYVDGFVTVDNYDWYMDELFQKAKREKSHIDMNKLRSFYVETLYKGIEHYEALAKKIYSRSPTHVMLLHENDLTALFVGDLVNKLKNNGWEISSPEDSYRDVDLVVFPESVTRHGQGRVVAHATQKKLPKPLVSGLEDEAVLRDLWAQYQVTSDTGKDLPKVHNSL